MASMAPIAAAGDAAPAMRAAILAGGVGSRMGGAPGSKAAVELAGRPLASYAIAAARLAGLAPVVVAKEDSWLPSLGCPVVHEQAEPRHPLSGIIAALERFGEPMVVIACDVPLVPSELLAELGHRRARFAMPIHPRPQPLVARYTPGLLPRLHRALDQRASLVDVAETLGGDGLRGPELRGFGDPETMFDNVNTPEDLRRVAALLRG